MARPTRASRRAPGQLATTRAPHHLARAVAPCAKQESELEPEQRVRGVHPHIPRNHQQALPSDVNKEDQHDTQKRHILRHAHNVVKGRLEAYGWAERLTTNPKVTAASQAAARQSRQQLHTSCEVTLTRTRAPHIGDGGAAQITAACAAAAAARGMRPACRSAGWRMSRAPLPRERLRPPGQRRRRRLRYSPG
jgi:hypothetical protein